MTEEQQDGTAIEVAAAVDSAAEAVQPVATENPPEEPATEAPVEPSGEAVEPPIEEAAPEVVPDPAVEAPAAEDPAVEAAEPAPEPEAAVEPEPVAVTVEGAALEAGADLPAVDPVAEAPAEPSHEAVAPLTADELAAAVPAAPEPPPAAEPTTMAELLAEQSADIRSFKHGDVVEGAIVRIDRDEILVDIGAKSEGVVSNRELYGRNAESAPTLAIGDVVLVYVLQPESPEGHAVLSLRRAGLERKWRSMQEQFETGVIIEAPVIDHNKGGLIVDCGIRGFVPISQIVDFPRRPQNEQPRDAAQEIAEKLQPYVGR
ncbi:MAG: S1 RNA-binding domain-containing protein, partial [Chloroflexi bacterium]|nr:S1 RNA-binding domain-containing protein [Chloroflexota bacterium]